MKRVLLSLVIIVFSLFCITGCGNSKLSEIANKFNSSAAIKSFADNGYNLKATAKSDSIVITVTQQDQDPVNFSFNVEDNIISSEVTISEEIDILKVFSALYLIDAIGQVNGYSDGEMLQSLNDENIFEYTLENQGLYINNGEYSFAFKADINKKVPLVDFSNVYITVEDLIDAKEYIQEGSFSMQRGNVALNTFTNDGTSEIVIVEKDELTSNSYNTLLSVVQVIFDSAKAPLYIESKYASVAEGNKSFGGVKIDTEYELDEDELAAYEGETVKAMKVTINHKTFKKILSK